MNIFTLIYTEVLWRPLLNGLVWFYTALPIQDLGLSIIILTLIIRILLTPLLIRASLAQKNLQKIQPQIKAVQDKFKNDREQQARALMELYQKEKVNPFSGCLMVLIQLPILIALFQVFREGLEAEQFRYLYSFIQNPGAINPVSLGIFDLSRGNAWLGVLAALSQFFQTKLTSAAPAVQVSERGREFSKMIQWQALYLFPALIFIWSFTFPAALILYWTVLNIFGILQEIIMKKLAK